MKVVFVFLFALVIAGSHQCSTPECLYMQERANLVKMDESFSFDAHVVLNHHEKTVSNFLSSIVEKEIERFDANSRFITAKIFTDIKEEIEKSPLFKILSLMPKGGILHSHGIGDTKELIKMATYRNDCWINTGIHFIDHFFIACLFHFLTFNREEFWGYSSIWILLFTNKTL